MKNFIKNKKHLVLAIILIFVFAGGITILAPKPKSYQVKRYLQQGQYLLSSGNYEEAEKNFNKALRLAPQSPVVHIEMAKTSLMAGDYNRAEDYLKKSLNLSPASDTKGSLYLEMGKIYALRGNPEQAIAYFKEALNQRIDSLPQKNYIEALAYSMIGIQNIFLGNSTEALENLNKSLEVELEEPMNSYVKGDVYNALANYYLIFDDIEKAKGYCEKAIELNISPAVGQKAYLGLGKYYLYSGDYYKAASSFETSLKLFQAADLPKGYGYAFSKFQIYDELGKCYINLGEYEKAKEYFNEILQIRKDLLINPEYEYAAASTAAFLGLGRCCLGLGDYDKALEHFNRGLNLILGSKPKSFYEKFNIHFLSTLFHYELAETYYKKGDIVEAKKEVKGALELIQSIPSDELLLIGKIQWFEDRKSLPQKISLLKNELEKK